MREQLRQKFLRYLNCENIQVSCELLDIFSDYFLKSVKVHSAVPDKSPAESDAKLINQMILTKNLHIRQLTNGVSFVSTGGLSINPIIDPCIVAVLLRNVFETVAAFNLIYRQTKTNDEKTILYNLWVISGLKYRQRFINDVTTKENLEKISEERQIIEDLICEIQQTKLYNDLELKERSKLDNKIKDKDYKIKFDGIRVIYLTWQESFNNVGIKEGLFDDIYTYFSLFAHPSNASVLQFRDMFQKSDKAFLKFTNLHLQKLSICLSIFAADYIHVFPDMIKTFESEPLVNQIIINTHNRLARGEEYSINDAGRALL